MWEAALETEALQAALAGAGRYEQRIVRMWGIPESELAGSLRAMEADGRALDELEVTTCLRRGEMEIATVFEPSAAAEYDAFEAALLDRHGDALFSRDGRRSTRRGRRCCSGRRRDRRRGRVVHRRPDGRPADRPRRLLGLRARRRGRVLQRGEGGARRRDPRLIERHGAVSPEVAAALADGARERFGADLGIGITGIAGPGGGTPDKPVGTVCLSVAGPAGRLDRTVRLPGDRATVRERTTTVVMHLLRRLLAP